MTQVALHTRFEDITEAQWGELLAHSADATVFQSRAWLTGWWECFGQPDWTLHLLTAEQHGQLVALAPLYRRPARFGGHELRLLGEGHSDYLLFMVRRGAEQVIDDLLQAMAVSIDEGSNALLADVPETSLLHVALQQRASTGGGNARLALHCTHRTPCPRVALAGNQAGIAALLRKQSLRRHYRSLASLGPVVVTHHVDPANILSVLPQLFAMHRARWDGTATPSQFTDSANRRFYEVVTASLPPGTVWLTTVHAGRDLAAIHFGLRSGSDFIWYKPAYEVSLQRHGPGEVLLQALLQHAQAEGCREFDFARGDDAYKQRFATATDWNSSYEWISQRWPQRSWQRLRLAVRGLRSLRGKQ